MTIQDGMGTTHIDQSHGTRLKNGIAGETKHPRIASLPIPVTNTITGNSGLASKKPQNYRANRQFWRKKIKMGKMLWKIVKIDKTIRSPLLL
ncbi:MAG TPA: hypothetical protein VGG19_06165 [Tepidisphaeraceae bacterium]|jgi:hypothetical protein